MPWPTFWMEPAGHSRVALRRYVTGAAGSTCGTGFHAAVVWLDLVVPDGGERPTIGADDERWPAVCSSCAYVFGDGDERQVWLEAVYRVPATGELRVLHHSLHPPDVEPAGAGAMWDASWLPARWRGDDGIALVVRCPRNDGAGPGSDWLVDMPSTNTGARWRRDGYPRAAAVTAHPSISIGTPGEPDAYHGWLTGGVLSDPI